MKTNLLCSDCLTEYGGAERRCPQIPGCRMSKYPTFDLAGDYERDTRGFVGEPRHVRGRGGNSYPTEFVSMHPYTYGGWRGL
jgi:hypothetical protein